MCRRWILAATLIHLLVTAHGALHLLTPVSRSKSKISMAEAARIASEIERGDHSSVANIHMLEERGIAIDDSQMDEEDRYGAVVRDAPPPPPAAANGAGAAAAAAARPNAWAAGRPRPLMPGAAPSAPIAIDMRREANKLRAQVRCPEGRLGVQLLHAG